MSFIDRLFLYKEKEHTGKSTSSDSGIDKQQLEDTDTGKRTKTDEAEAFSTAPEEEVYEVLEREILPAKIICPDCGGITLEGLDFCDKCGGELL